MVVGWWKNPNVNLEKVKDIAYNMVPCRVCSSHCTSNTLKNESFQKNVQCLEVFFERDNTWGSKLSGPIFLVLFLCRRVNKDFRFPFILLLVHILFMSYSFAIHFLFTPSSCPIHGLFISYLLLLPIRTFLFYVQFLSFPMLFKTRD